MLRTACLCFILFISSALPSFALPPRFTSLYLRGLLCANQHAVEEIGEAFAHGGRKSAWEALQAAVERKECIIVPVTTRVPVVVYQYGQRWVYGAESLVLALGVVYDENRTPRRAYMLTEDELLVS